jgi:hypothetical protein
MLGRAVNNVQTNVALTRFSRAENDYPSRPRPHPAAREEVLAALRETDRGGQTDLAGGSGFQDESLTLPASSFREVGL